MIWPGFVNQSVLCPCHRPGRQRLPQLLLLEFILQTEEGEPCNKLPEESQAIFSALELLLVWARALRCEQWVQVTQGSLAYPLEMFEVFGRVAEEGWKGKGRIDRCLGLALVFMLRPKWLEVFPELPLPPNLASSQLLVCQLLIRRKAPHLLCSIQAGTIISSGQEL